MADKCPFCKSSGTPIMWLKKIPGMAYDCQTTFVDGRPEGGRHRKCYEAEIAQLKARIAKLGRVAEAAKKLWCSYAPPGNDVAYAFNEDWGGNLMDKFPDRVVLGVGWPCARWLRGKDSLVGLKSGPHGVSKVMPVAFPRNLSPDIQGRPRYRLVLERVEDD